MANELIELPIALDDWKVFFDSKNQVVCLRQKEPCRIDLTELNPELALVGVFEVCPDVLLEAALLKAINNYLV